MIDVNGIGTVIPPSATSQRDISEFPKEIFVQDVVANGGDDCVFLNCKFPDGYWKNLQVFLPLTSDAVLHVLMAAFKTIYGANVTPNGAVDVSNLVGSTITFTEV